MVGSLNPNDVLNSQVVRWFKDPDGAGFVGITLVHAALNPWVVSSPQHHQGEIAARQARYTGHPGLTRVCESPQVSPSGEQSCIFGQRNPFEHLAGFRNTKQ